MVYSKKYGRVCEMESRMKTEKRKAIQDWVFFFVLWGIYTAATLFLFHRQSVNYAEKYISDIQPYIWYVKGEDVGYSYPYPILFKTAAFLSLFLESRMAMAFAVTGLNALTPLVMKWYLNCWDNRESLEKGEEKTGPGKRFLQTGLLFSLLFVSMLYPLWRRENRYTGVFSPNPFHNATYLAARGFAVWAFCSFMEIRLFGKKKAKDYLLFSVMLLLATMTKPSFTLGFVITAGMVLLTEFFRKLKQGVKKTFREYLPLAACFVPTFLDLLYQYKGVFVPAGEDVEQGIGFGFLTAWKTASEHVGLSVFLGLGFVIAVLCFQEKEIKKNRLYRFSLLMLLVNLVMMMVLYEKGYRMAHLNFAWGYMYGMFFAFAASLMILCQKTAQFLGVKKRRVTEDAEGGPDRRIPTMAALILQWAFYAAHLICGIVYFIHLLQGESFL